MHDRVKKHTGELFFHFAEHRKRVAQAGVKHGDQNLGFDRMVKPLTDQISDIHQVIDPLHGKTAGLNRYDDLVAGTDSVDCQKPKAWRAVNQDIIVEAFDLIDDFRELKLTADLIRQFLFKGTDQDIGWDDIKILAHFF